MSPTFELDLTLQTDSLLLHSSTPRNYTPIRSLKMTSTTNELAAPLLDNLPQHERDADAYDEEGGMSCCSLKLVVADDDDDDDDGSSEYKNNCVEMVAMLVLPALMFLQFGMAFYMSQVESDTGLRWSVVNFSIVVFVITAAVYRQALKDCKVTCSVAVLGLVLFGKVVPAFVVLMCGMLCFSFFVVVVAMASPEEDCDKELLRDEFEVGLEPTQIL
jgi:hypothetical protein